MFARNAPGATALLVLLTAGAILSAIPPQGSQLMPPEIAIATAEPSKGQQPPAPEMLPGPQEVQPEGAAAEGPAKPTEPIDLAAALKLAGFDNPEILIARQRVVIAVALAQYAAVQLLPSANPGMNYDAHAGALQQANGNILRVDRSALYVGAGANAVAAGTVNLPGLLYNLNVSAAIFDFLIARQEVERREFAAVAVRNEMFREVAVAYAELLRAVGRRSIARQVYAEASEVARMTAEYVKAGEAAAADGDRTANEQAHRRDELVEAEAEVGIASARLAELLALDQTICLEPVETHVLPMPIVPDNIPLCELIAIALLQRPELAVWQAAIREALLVLHGAKVLPFSPTMITGLSGGDFGGGSSIVHLAGQPVFGNMGLRNDMDLVAYWTLQNLGLGNLAMIREARARVGVQELERLRVLNQVRREVADADVRTHARFRQITRYEAAVRVGKKAFKEDFDRIRGHQGRPIELLESLRLLAQARYLYLDAIVDYNEAEIDLYVALGKPPADTLAKPVPTNFAEPLPKTQEQKPK